MKVVGFIYLNVLNDSKICALIFGSFKCVLQKFTFVWYLLQKPTLRAGLINIAIFITHEQKHKNSPHNLVLIVKPIHSGINRIQHKSGDTPTAMVQNKKLSEN